MNRFNKPWPHSPGVIAQVEKPRAGYEQLICDVEFEARIFNEAARFATYEAAVRWCQSQKNLRAEAELEANISVWGAPSGCNCNLCTRKLSSSIADEMSA